MAGLSLKQQLRTFIKSMADQGILDQRFQYLREMQGPVKPCIVSDTIITFINDADVAMAAVTRLLSDDEVNFEILISNVHQLCRSSGGVGGCRMAQKCRELQHASDERNKDRCIEFFERLKLEYQIFRGALNHIRQLEDTINSYDTRRRRP